jgi:hypothetical protein
LLPLFLLLLIPSSFSLFSCSFPPLSLLHFMSLSSPPPSP